MKAVKIIFLFSLLMTTTQAQALLYLNSYGGINAGSIEGFAEKTGGNTLTHDGWLIGAGVGGRVGLSFLILRAGVVGEYAKVQLEGEREDVDRVSAFDGDEDYDNVITRNLYGAFVGVSLPALPLTVFAEYYPTVEGKVTYAEGRSENIFADGDKLNGSGFGAGLGFEAAIFSTHFMVRNITYDEFTLSGTKTELPNGTYDKMETWEVSLQIGVAIDL
ncbi:MAG: hypothetical protein ACPGJV_11260 [Bacteriovoracaceae bacterium]